MAENPDNIMPDTLSIMANAFYVGFAGIWLDPKEFCMLILS